MISKKMQNSLNAQINAEIYSAYLYLAMSADLNSKNLPGFANWMRIQAQEEMGHAMKIYAFIEERLGRVVLKAIAEPQKDFASALSIFEQALKHEQKVTGLINKLVDQAIEENDHATHGFLQWFVDEQVEEEATADAIVQKLKMTKDMPSGLFMLDKELAQRAATKE